MMRKHSQLVELIEALEEASFEDVEARTNFLHFLMNNSFERKYVLKIVQQELSGYLSPKEVKQVITGYREILADLLANISSAPEVEEWRRLLTDIREMELSFSDMKYLEKARSSEEQEIFIKAGRVCAQFIMGFFRN